ncbi:MAG: protein kinase [bacterium]|nr:protein kinase [bacterium]
MGEVYEAEDTSLDRRVALKVRHRDVPREIFLNEAKAAMSLSQENVCRIHDVHDEPPHEFITMQYIAGSDLGSRLRQLKPQPLPPGEAVHLARGICAGLSALHKKKLFHQDLNPANVLIGDQGQAVICDLGLAGSRPLGGTERYMAPEQISGPDNLQPEVSIQTDLYSFGLSLYEMLTGASVQREDMSRSLEKLSGIDDSLCRLIRRCLDSDPRKRPGSADELIVDLPRKGTRIFRQFVIFMIRNRARWTSANPDDRAIKLATYLFAIASQMTLGTDSKLGKLDRTQCKPPLSHALNTLVELDDELSDAELYQRMVEALVAIDAEYADSIRDRGTVTGSTTIEGIGFGSTRVLHWHRPVSAFRVLRGEREDSAMDAGESVVRRPRPHPSDHLANLGMYWSHSELLPDVERVESPRAPLVKASGLAAAAGAFRIALCPLRGSFHPRFELVGEDQSSFRIHQGDPMVDREDLSRHLKDVLRAASDADVKMVILPELTVDGDSRRELVEELCDRPRARRPYGLLAGSFHLWSDGDQPVNEAVLYGIDGERMMSHRKMGRFRLSSASLPQIARKFFVKGEAVAAEPPCPPDGEIVEDICEGRSLRFLDTSLGRLAILICADAIEPETGGYRDVVAALRPDLVLLVAMSPKTGPFDDFIRRMAVERIGTLFVNAACVCDGRHSLVHCDLALHRTAKAPPTQVRWCPEDVLEVGDYRSRPGGWRPLAIEKDGTGAGVSWLMGGAETKLGLVVDLGVHWREPS